jgi:hypothetical protein
MTHALTILAGLPAARWSTVLCIGAGDGRDWRPISALPADRRIVVDADDFACVRLQAAMRATPGVEVVQQAVGLPGTTGTWFRFNLPELNGLTDHVKALRPRYPRLALIGTAPVSPCSLTELLARLQIERRQGTPSALVLNQLGDGKAILDNADPQALCCFDWIVWAALAPGRDDTALTRLAEKMESSAFVVHQIQRVDDLQRIITLRMDPAKQRLSADKRELHARVGELERAQKDLRAVVSRAEAKLDFATELLLAERRT